MTQRKLTAAFFQSLDGVIQGGGNPDEDRSGGFTLGGWTVPLTDESAGPWMEKLFIEPEYDLLLAKRTYEIFSAYWPYHLDDPIGEKFERINKYVLTHSDEPLTWAHSHKLSGDTVDVVRKLKATDGRDLLIQGSGTLYEPLLSARLIDRLVVMTFPIVLGKGKRVFTAATKPAAFKLVEHFVSDVGVVATAFEPDGDVKTGTFETKASSEAELERRKRWPK
jgi:dihydrofolate reductase